MTLVGGSAAGAVVFQACGVPEDELLIQASIEMPEDLVSGLDNRYATLCRQCPTSEGIVVRVMEGRAKKVEGNVDYPLNRGRHSARCEAGLQALYHPDRISAPLLRRGERGSGQWDEISWTDAISRLAHQLEQLKEDGEETGTEAEEQTGMVMVTDPVGAHLGMVVERFVSGYGGRHFGYEPLERTSLRTAMKQVFGQDVMPDFDIENTEYLLSFGADFLSTWVSPVRYARGYGEFRQGDRKRGTLVQVESRFSMTAANADEWMYVNPGREGLLALSIAQVIISEGLGDGEAARALAAVTFNPDRFAPEAVAADVGVAADRIRRMAREFAGHRPSLAIGGGSAAAHTNGLANLNAIYSLNYLVGSVGKPGGVVFNPAPPLNDVPASPATASFVEMQGLVSDMNRGEVKVLMVRGADPVYGLPSGAAFREATYNVPVIFSFSDYMDDTTSMADVVLPQHNYLEDWGSDIPDSGPGYQMVGFQQPVVRPFFEPRGIHLGTKGFADALLTTAQVLGIDMGLPGATFKEILQDGAKRLFDRGGGKVGLNKTSDVPSFKAFWNSALRHGFWSDESATYTGPTPTPPPLPADIAPPSLGRLERKDSFHLIPFASNSLTDGRGAHLPWLQAAPDPLTTATWRTWVEISMKVAERMDIKEGDVIKVESDQGSIEALAYPHPGVSPDIVSIPIGQGHAAGGRYAEGRGSNVLSILSPLTDKDTGALAWAATRVRIQKTGEWVRLPRFENSAPDLAVDEDHQIIQITPLDS